MLFIPKFTFASFAWREVVMRGDQSICLWRVYRGIEVSSNELTAAEIACPDGTLETARKRSPSKACSKSWNGLFCYGRPEPVVFRIFLKWPGLMRSLLPFERKTRLVWEKMIGSRSSFFASSEALLERSDKRLCFSGLSTQHPALSTFP
jgi:hypothetical protein